MSTDIPDPIEGLDNGIYMEIKFAYNEGILLPVDDGAELLKMFVKAIPIKRDYNKPVKLWHKTEYPQFQLTTGASIKEERLEYLLQNG